MCERMVGPPKGQHQIRPWKGGGGLVVSFHHMVDVSTHPYVAFGGKIFSPFWSFHPLPLPLAPPINRGGEGSPKSDISLKHKACMICHLSLPHTK